MPLDQPGVTIKGIWTMGDERTNEVFIENVFVPDEYVVGDVNREAVADMIKAHFAALTGPPNERPRPDFDVPEQPGTRYLTVTDRETTALTAAGAIASVMIEPENWRMMASSCLVACHSFSKISNQQGW